MIDGEGNLSGKAIPTNSNWKVFAKKTINGKTYYRLGTDKQWVDAKYVKSIMPVAQPQIGKEEAVNKTVYIPVINNNPNWKVALRDGNGKVTGEYIPTDSQVKVTAKKTINGETYYRIGSEKEWIPAQFTSSSLNNEEAISGVAFVPTIHNNRNWKVALRDGNGHLTGKYISTNTNWKVFAKKNINGQELVRIGSQLQWIPMQYVAWIH